MPKVFVYGSLKRGQSNAFMMEGARFVAPARSVRCWRLVALPHYPALVREEGPCRITGEVWEVPAPMMAVLDRFEEVPALYTRHEIEVELEAPAGAAAGNLLMAHAYFMPAALAAAGRELHGGCWPA
ncbi:gamma-glutamylcyclotransferase [Herbaspirillum sp. DW155]|uniref:gamma-glutamylcyclotransferase family protein n=1 Tax=Herbaspirillum sp. DW155 TaxID=3095609 RepID=UPI00308645E5|nr:gamma-glutamylcyclotransferase [Herbaspirillum sp. DW155]